MKTKLFVLMLLITLGSVTNMVLAQTYTITLDPNSGNVTPTEITCTEGQPIGDLPNPTRDRFTFAGWYVVPGLEDTRITNQTIYNHGTHNETFRARWTKKTVTLTFIGFDGITVVGSLNVSADGGSLVDIPADIYKLPVADDEFFAGYYTRICGEGERIYDGIDEAGDLHPVITGQCPFTNNTKLVAHKTHVKHNVFWDYSYDATSSAGSQSWKNISNEDATRIKYGKLTFMNNEGSILKTIYFNADNVTDKPESSITSAFDTHTTTTGQFHLQLASKEHPETPDNSLVTGSDATSDDGNAGIWNVYFTDDQLSQFTQYDFEPISWDGESGEKTKAANWIRTTDKENHSTIFSFTGGGGTNIATLNWTVKLEGLRVYPNVVIAKPLFKNNNEEWEEITQVAHIEGIRCEKSETGDGYATYTGSLPVWKLDANNDSYTYAIGMSAFEIQGQTIYLNEADAGSFSTAFNSANSAVGTDTKTSVWHPDTENFDNIHYTIQASEIPVVHFIVDPLKDEELAPATPMYIFGTQNGTIENFGTKYRAIREGYAFCGWSETDGATEPTYGNTTTYTFNGATTLYPVWKTATTPMIIPAKQLSCGETVEVTIIDEGGLTGVIVTVNDETQTLTDGKFILPVPMDDASVTYNIVATNDTGNSAEETVTIYKEHNIYESILCDAENYHCDVCGYTNEELKAEFDARDYMSMTAVDGDVVISFKKVGSPTDYTIQVSEDGNHWSEPQILTETTELATIPEGETYYFRHGAAEVTGRVSMDENNYWSYTMDSSSDNAVVEAGGNVMSLLDATCKKMNIGTEYAFARLFMGCSKLTVAPKLPATNLGAGFYCYYYMFSGTGLTEIPVLPATKTYQGVYEGMFYNCHNLVTSPTLPATNAEWRTYVDMFNGCENLAMVNMPNLNSIASSGDPFSRWLNNTATGETATLILPIDMIGSSSLHLPSNWQWATKLKLNEDPLDTGFYTTFYDSRYDYTVANGHKAYSGSIDGDELLLTPTPDNIIPKGNGVILHGGSGEVLLTVNNDEASTILGNVLTGSDVDTTAPDFCYILSYGQNGLGFYRYAEGNALSAHKAYMTYLHGDTEARALRMVFDEGEVDGIEQIENGESEIENSVIYNLNGIRLNKLQKGINIVRSTSGRLQGKNGKKIIVK